MTLIIMGLLRIFKPTYNYSRPQIVEIEKVESHIVIYHNLSKSLFGNLNLNVNVRDGCFSYTKITLKST